MAKMLGSFELLEAISRGVGKPVLQVGFIPSPDGDDAAIEEWRAGLRSAAPYLFDDEGSFRFGQFLIDGGGYLVCDDEAECQRLYDMTVGDDGPTHLNPYAGSTRVYACTSMGNENT